MNDTAWFSDVVLPEASYLERYDPLNVVGDKAFLRQPVIEPQGEAKSALWIYKQLGERLGLGDFFQYRDEEDYLNQQLAPLGVSLDEVRQQGLRRPARRRRPTSANRRGTPQRQDRTLLATLDKAGFPGVPHVGGTARTRRRAVLPADRQGGAVHPVWHPEQPAAAQVFGRAAPVDERRTLPRAWA